MFNLTSYGDADIFIAKYDSSGNFVFAKNIGVAGNDNGSAIDIDGNSNNYITGFYADTVDFDPDIGIVNLISIENSTDIFIAKNKKNKFYRQELENRKRRDGSWNLFCANN